MAKFVVDPQLLKKAARLVVQPVNDIAKDVEYEARQLAPALKIWDTQPAGVLGSDELVRDPWHVNMEGQERPANLRFALETHPWDARHRTEHGVVGPETYMRHPRDESSGAVANVRNCRCVMTEDPDGIAKKIGTEKAKGLGEGRHAKHVVATVYCQGEWVVQSEKGTVYPGDLVARGARFMEKAARKVRNKRRRVPGRRRRF